MKQFLALLFMVFVFASCEQENIRPQEEAEKPNALALDVPAFLQSNKLNFQGNLNGERVSWQFAAGEQNFQSVKGFCYVGKNEPCNPNRNFSFSLAQNNHASHIKVQLPAINVNTKSEFDRLFAVGKKQLQDYSFIISKADKTLQLSNAGATGEVEILKTAEVTGANNEKSLRVWFRIQADFQGATNSQTRVPVEGLLLAEFSGYDFQTSNCGL